MNQGVCTIAAHLCGKVELIGVDRDLGWANGTLRTYLKGVNY
jgi:hypothetical protein